MGDKSRKTGKQKPIRVGVIGVGRGSGFASGATELVGMKLVALCFSIFMTLLHEVCGNPAGEFLRTAPAPK